MICSVWYIDLVNSYEINVLHLKLLQIISEKNQPRSPWIGYQNSSNFIPKLHENI